jgi:ribose-phosphate pyrophosphokinase
MISTGGTLVEAAKALNERGATQVFACATHGIFAGAAFGQMADSHLSEIVVTNTIPEPPEAKLARIKTISVAALFAEAIMRIHKDLSLSTLFM